jgi:hypothetical protein
MKKERTALPVAAALLMASIPAFGNETRVVRTTAPEKDFAAHLPALQPHEPWLHLDARTKLPKGDYPLGREAESIGRLAVLGAFLTQLSALEDTQPIFERRK